MMVECFFLFRYERVNGFLDSVMMKFISIFNLMNDALTNRFRNIFKGFFNGGFHNRGYGFKIKPVADTGANFQDGKRRLGKFGQCVCQECHQVVCYLQARYLLFFPLPSFPRIKCNQLFRIQQLQELIDKKRIAACFLKYDF